MESTRENSRQNVAAPAIVEFQGVTMQYQDEEPVLDNVSFSISPGEYRYIRGPSGAGKSTLLKLAYHGLLSTSGTVRIFGEAMKDLSRERVPLFRRRIGVVFQDFRLLEHLTVEQNVALPLTVTGLGGDKRAMRNVRELLDWVGLKHRLQVNPSTLSGGEKQRAAIARAVISKPRLLLADEPTGNVDDTMGRRIMQLFEELNRSGTTIMLATHSDTLTAAFPHDTLVLENGHVRLDNISA